MQFKSFRNAILFYFLGLMIIVEIAGFFAFDAVLTRNTRNRIDNDLEAGARIFTRMVDERTRQLVTATRMLSGDFAFKSAFATGDHRTVLSALMNHQTRIGADVMMLVSADE